ncbi:MAG: ATP-binding protein [bacterium]|nr:ATP-binding protein [bacterium]
MPPALTFTGINGSGKSSRAAHLLFLAFRAGLRPVYWVSEMELLDESRTWEAQSRGCRHLYTNARAAGALVVDEVGTTRGAWADTEASINIMLQLVSHRLASRALTIYTSHRPLNKKAAEERGQDPGDSLRVIAPALFDRLTEGLIITLPSVSHRGKWAREARTENSDASTETGGS